MAPQNSDPFASIAQPIQAVAPAVAAPQSTSATGAVADPFASIAQPMNQAAAPDHNILGKMAQVSSDLDTGLVKGMGDTVSGVSHLINKLPVIGETLAPSQGISALDTLDASSNTAQKVGKIGETAAEFAVGDEALSGLSKATKLVELADKYPMVARVLNAAKDHPWLAKMVAETTKGGVQGLVKGAQQNQAVTGAAIGAGTGALVNPFIGAVGAVAGAVGDAVPSVASKFTGSEIQPALKAGINDVWESVAKDASVPAPTAKSVQDAGEQVADSILARSKANYAKIDAATGNRFSATEKSLGDVTRDLRSVTNDTEENNLIIRKARLEMQMNNLMDEAQTKGVSQATVDAAKADFKKAQAIYDTNHAIRMSTTGVRPGMQGSEAVPEEVNAKALMNRLNKLHNSGRLQQAVGDDAAEDLIGHTAIARKAADDVAKNIGRAKIAAHVVPLAGTAAGALGTAYELTKP